MLVLLFSSTVLFHHFIVIVSSVYSYHHVSHMYVHHQVYLSFITDWDCNPESRLQVLPGDQAIAISCGYQDQGQNRWRASGLGDRCGGAPLGRVQRISFEVAEWWWSPCANGFGLLCDSGIVIWGAETAPGHVKVLEQLQGLHRRGVVFYCLHFCCDFGPREGKSNRESSCRITPCANRLGGMGSPFSYTMVAQTQATCNQNLQGRAW